jgi:hypothetical protein
VELQSPDYVEGLLVGVDPGDIEIEMSQRSESLHVQLAAIRLSIKAPRHEVAPAALLEESAFALGQLSGTLPQQLALRR